MYSVTGERGKSKLVRERCKINREGARETRWKGGTVQEESGTGKTQEECNGREVKEEGDRGRCKIDAAGEGARVQGGGGGGNDEEGKWHRKNASGMYSATGERCKR
jgi:hypothetical protein